ncbi:hypothetical protein [Microbispora sp. NPDC046933]|uniref:hypothetical protein n=1 Tax=Microbispora sp. NPDC046933 TaxID=3155618 RepID=UPI003403D75C
MALIKEVPAGSYVLHVDLQIKQQTQGEDPFAFDAECGVETSAGKVTPWNRVAVGEGQEGAMAYTRTVVLDTPGPLSLKCFAQGRSSDAAGKHVTFYHQSLTATRVGKLTVYPWPTGWPQAQ